MRYYRPNLAKPPRIQTFEASRKIREDFRDEPMGKVTAVAWNWPRQMVHVGECLATMYASDKWGEPRPIDYKHNSEGPQQLYCRPGFVVDYATGGALGIESEPATLRDIFGSPEMPDSFAVLDRVMSLQARFNGLEKPYQIDINGCWLGAAKHPRTSATFLIVYSDGKTVDGEKLKPEVHCLITGDILDVKKDGIVG